RRWSLLAFFGSLLGTHLKLSCDFVLSAVDAHALDAMSAQETGDDRGTTHELEEYVGSGIVTAIHRRFEKLPDGKGLLIATKCGGDLAATGRHEVRACNPDCLMTRESSLVNLGKYRRSERSFEDAHQRKGLSGIDSPGAAGLQVADCNPQCPGPGLRLELCERALQ